MKRWGRRLLAVLAVATGAALVAILLSAISPFQGAIEAIDAAIYDGLYPYRNDGDWKRDSPLVIVAVDQYSIDRMAADEQNHYRWPWPRAYWGAAIEYLQNSGAKVIAVDLLFEEPSGYERESGDDTEFAAKLDSLSIPVIQSFQAKLGGDKPRFAPPVKKPQKFGAVDVIDGAVIRSYAGSVNGQPSLAVQAVRAAGATLPPWASDTFLLHFYNPEMRRQTSGPYPYLPAYDVIRAALSGGSFGSVKQAEFQGKIVLIGATAAATYDLKSAPVAKVFPSVEAHATAIDDLLHNQRVEVMHVGIKHGMAWLGAMLAALGAIVPRRVGLKVLLALLAVGAIFGVTFVNFDMTRQIRWLAPTTPLLGGLLGTIGGLGWTYFAEDRQRRAMLKILSQYVSPHVARELARKGELSLGGQRRVMTVLFTDIAGFTSISENMTVEQIETFVNDYLSQVTGVLLGEDATVDKFIGDAVMCFWNAPLDQADHASRACEAAIKICRLERQQRERRPAGVEQVHTRIGINTGLMVVGNMGSVHKANYTVIGDAVNLASRLEGSNKIYNSQVLVSETTVNRVPNRFLFRRLDRLRVKGRTKPLVVYELMEELSQATEAQRRLVERYELALAAYERKKWDAAEEVLVELQREFPEDGPTAALLGRVRELRANPPPAEWDGVHDAEIK